jgi:hypothetical protein
MLSRLFHKTLSRLFRPRERRRCLAAGALALAVVGGSTAGLVSVTPVASGAPAMAATDALGGWQEAPVPSPPGSQSSLAAVSGTAATDVWTVGESLSSSGSRLVTLTEHFDGQGWTVVRSPSLGGMSQLFGVAALSGDDAWAVGVGSSTLGNVPMILHWNGRAWRLVAGAYSASGELRAVSATSARDVWAVGSAMVGSSSQTLIEHFDGTTWSVVASPTPDSGDQLSGVAAVTPRDAWAVGSSVSSTHESHTVREHWNGTTWTATRVSDQGSELEAVGASSTGDVWAVGVGLSVQDSLGEHFDGARWAVVTTPRPSAIVNSLEGVTAVSPLTAWAVGASYEHGLHQVIDHWDGTNWQISLLGGLGSVAAVTTIPGGGSWAVGTSGTGPLAATPFAAFHS